MNGVGKQRVASINPATGAPVAGFTANVNAAATAVVATNSTVYIGGQFTDGQRDTQGGSGGGERNHWSARVAGSRTIWRAGSVSMARSRCRLWCSPRIWRRLLVVHTARQIAGQDPLRASGLISHWNQPVVAVADSVVGRQSEFVGGIQRIYAGAISPDGSVLRGHERIGWRPTTDQRHRGRLPDRRRRPRPTDVDLTPLRLGVLGCDHRPTPSSSVGTSTTWNHPARRIRGRV